MSCFVANKKKTSSDPFLENQRSLEKNTLKKVIYKKKLSESHEAAERTTHSTRATRLYILFFFFFYVSNIFGRSTQQQ